MVRLAQELGKNTELRVQKFLLAKGLKLITANFRCKFGEIDLIMLEQDTIVFIEVRYRRSEVCGSALESINKSKQRNIINTANYYLQKCNLFEKIPCRFDVVVMLPNGSFKWIKNAF